MACPAGVGPHCQVRATLALAAQWCHLVVEPSQVQQDTPAARWPGQAGQQQGPRSPRSLQPPYQSFQSLGQGTPGPENLPHKPSLALSPLSEQNEAARDRQSWDWRQCRRLQPLP